MAESRTPRLERRRRTARPSRVLLVMQSSTIGGMERHCIELAGELRARGAAVAAAVPEDASLDEVADSLQRCGARVERINTDARSGRRAQALGILRLSRLARRFGPDVIHLHVGGVTGGLGAAVAGRFSARAVVVLTEHDVPDRMPGLWHRLNRRLLDLSVHAVIAVSRHNAQLREQRLGARADRLAVVLNGVSLPADEPSRQAANRQEVRAELGIAPDLTVIGTVVRLVDGKGLDSLLKAFAEVVRSVDARLLIAGGGPLESELRSLSRELGIVDKVLMVGHQPEPGRYVDVMDAFVLPVPVGSGSIALLEAMARGKAAVITFGDGEEPVVPGETGIWAPPNNPPALASALLRLSQDRELRSRLGQAAAAHVRIHYSIQRLVDDLSDVYAAARVGGIPPGLRFTDAVDRRPGSRRAYAPAP